jgi:hypothetical protein
MRGVFFYSLVIMIIRRIACIPIPDMSRRHESRLFEDYCEDVEE